MHKCNGGHRDTKAVPRLQFLVEIPSVIALVYWMVFYIALMYIYIYGGYSDSKAVPRLGFLVGLPSVIAQGMRCSPPLRSGL